MNFCLSTNRLLMSESKILLVINELFKRHGTIEQDARKRSELFYFILYILYESKFSVTKYWTHRWKKGRCRPERPLTNGLTQWQSAHLSCNGRCMVCVFQADLEYCIRTHSCGITIIFVLNQTEQHLSIKRIEHEHWLNDRVVVGGGGHFEWFF